MSPNVNQIVEQQIARWIAEKNRYHKPLDQPSVLKPVVTVSRMLGSGGADIARGVAERLGCQLMGVKLIDEIANRGDVRRELVDAMDEKARSEVHNWLESLLAGKVFGHGDYYHFLLETVESLSRLGSVVILGRGAAFVPRLRPRLDVSVIAPLEHRMQRLMDREGYTRSAAQDAIRRSDGERKRFVRTLFGKEWLDPENFDVVLNTANIGLDTAVTMIESAWQRIVSAIHETDVYGAD